MASQTAPVDLLTTFKVILTALIDYVLIYFT